MTNNDQEPIFHPFSWPDRQTGPLHGRIGIGDVDGAPAVVSVELWGVDPTNFEKPVFTSPRTVDAPIRAADLRIPIGRFLDAELEKRRALARASRALYGDVPGHEETVRAFEARLGTKRSGRPRLTDERLKAVAAVYTQAVDEHDRAPARAVFEAFKDCRTLETARGWVRHARKRGFLPAHESRSKR